MKSVHVNRHRRRTESVRRLQGRTDFVRRRSGNAEVQALAQGYNAYQGLPSVKDVDAKAQPEVQRQIAAAYEALPTYDPAADAAYFAFMKEVQQQYQLVLLNSDIEFDFT